jgi:RHS repeat-associated protein
MDASGNFTEYQWDYRNRLIRVRNETNSGNVTQTVFYVYDAFDRRIAKYLVKDSNAASQQTTYWAFDGQQAALEFEDSDGDGPAEASLSRRYLYGPGVDMILADERVGESGAPGEVFWPLADHLGSVRDVVDSSGTVREHIVYNSFGKRVVEQDYDSSGSAIDSTDPDAIDFLFGYTGRDWDSDTQLQNNRARWYDPEQGRWISNDPIGFNAGDPNLQRYVGNKSTTYTDPTGYAEHGENVRPSTKGKHQIGQARKKAQEKAALLRNELSKSEYLERCKKELDEVAEMISRAKDELKAVQKRLLAIAKRGGAIHVSTRLLLEEADEFKAYLDAAADLVNDIPDRVRKDLEEGLAKKAARAASKIKPRGKWRIRGLGKFLGPLIGFAITGDPLDCIAGGQLGVGSEIPRKTFFENMLDLEIEREVLGAIILELEGPPPLHGPPVPPGYYD